MCQLGAVNVLPTVQKKNAVERKTLNYLTIFIIIASTSVLLFLFLGSTHRALFSLPTLKCDIRTTGNALGSSGGIRRGKLPSHKIRFSVRLRVESTAIARIVIRRFRSKLHRSFINKARSA